jgi:hypothetical protein
MERLGIAEEMKQKTKLMDGGGQNPKAVSAGEIQRIPQQAHAPSFLRPLFPQREQHSGRIK